MSTPTQRSTPLDPIMGALIAECSSYLTEDRSATAEPPSSRPSLENSSDHAEDNAAIRNPDAHAGVSDTQPLLSGAEDDNLGPDFSDEDSERKRGTDKSETSWIRTLGWRRTLILITLCFARICSASLASLLAPFFPNKAHQMGASAEEVGLIFGCFQLVVFMFSPLYGRYLAQIGAKFMFVAGNVVLSVCGVLFGILDWCPSNYFVMMCFCVRFVEAMAAAAQGTANQAIASHTVPQRVSTVMGLLEACFCLGLTLGPVVGGLLNTVGGYYLPFAVMGGVSLLNGCAAIFLLPASSSMESKAAEENLTSSDVQEGNNIQEASNIQEGNSRTVEEQTISKMTMLKFSFIPVVFLTGLMAFVAQAAIGYIDVGLSPHIYKDIQVKSPVTIGLIFLIPSGIVIILAPIYGIIADKFKWAGRPMMIGGCLLSGVSFLFLGPCPILPMIQPYNETLWLVIVSLVVGGVAWASLVVAYQEFISAARKMGLQDTLATHGMVSGIFSAFNSLGAFVGPTVAGPLLHRLGFPWATTVMAGSIVVPGILLLVYTVGEWFCSWSKPRTDRSNTHEPGPLQNGSQSN